LKLEAEDEIYALLGFYVAHNFIFLLKSRDP